MTNFALMLSAVMIVGARIAGCGLIELSDKRAVMARISKREVIVHSNPTSAAVMKTLEGTRFQTLRQSALSLVADGLTSIEEVDRAVGG